MTFKEALKKLNIEDYEERILNSTSRGELFHCADYIILAKAIKPGSDFRTWFVEVVEFAERTWQRPESVFQHILTMVRDK